MEDTLDKRAHWSIRSAAVIGCLAAAIWAIVGVQPTFAASSGSHSAPLYHWVTLSQHTVQIPDKICSAIKKAHTDTFKIQDCQATTGIQVELPAGKTSIPDVIGGGGGGGCGAISTSYMQYYTMSTLGGGYHVQHSGTFTYSGSGCG